MKTPLLALLVIIAVLPIFSQSTLSFPLEGEVTDALVDDFDGDGKLDYVFGTWNYLENPSLLYWWQFFWERGMVSFYSGDRRVFKRHMGAFVNSVSVVDFGEKQIVAGTTVLEGMPSGYVNFFSLGGEQRGVFKTDGKVKKVLALDGGKRLLVLNYREPERQTQLIILGKGGIQKTVVISDLIGEAIQTDMEGDGRGEIIVGSVFDTTSPHLVYLLDHNLSEIGRMETDDCVESLDAADLDGDAVREIIVGTYNYVYAFRRDGSLLWRYELPIGPVYALAAFDITGDGASEIVFTSHETLYVLSGAGTRLSYRELPFKGFYLLIKDWERDGAEEIVVSDGSHFLAVEPSELPLLAETPPPPSPAPPSGQPASTPLPPLTGSPPPASIPPQTPAVQSTFFPSSIKICGVNAIAEVITLCNEGVAPVDIGGWTLSDNSGFYSIPGGTIILSSGSWSVDITAYNPARGERGLLLDDDSDYLELRDANGNLIDRRTWGTYLSFVSLA